MKYLFSGVGALIALATFVAINVLSNAFLKNQNLDLTEHQLFTLSEGSRTIASGLEEPIHLYFYYSKDAAKEIPPVVAYHERVLNVLESYVRHSDGMLVLEQRNPESYSEAEEQAAAHGITGIPIGPEALYFGLAASNSVDDTEVIAFFGDLSGGGLGFDKRERFLEYDISRLIYSLAHPKKPRVAFLSALELNGTPGNPQMGQQGTPPWRIISEMRRFFDLDVLPLSTQRIPEDIDALVLVQPRQFSEALLYGIDQFVMRGGKLIAFVDPHCAVDQGSNDPNNPMGNMGNSRESELNRLFSAWGFESVAHTFVADDDHCVSRTLGAGQAPLKVVSYLELKEERLNGEDPITSQLDTIAMFIAGQLKPTADATTSFEPLITTSERGMTMDTTRVQGQPDYLSMLQGYVPGAEELVLGARVSGQAQSAFPEGDPFADAGAEDQIPHLAESDGPINVIAIADADMLYDQFWIQERRMGQFSLGYSLLSNNCDLLSNALSNMTGGDELISIRARGKFSRPFERVKKIRDLADAEFLKEEQELTRLLEEAEEEINTLLAQQAPQDASGAPGQLILSPEVQERIESFRTNKVKIGKKLRNVKHDRNKDIDALGFKLKVINIVGVPALVILAGSILGLSRRSNRKR